MASTRNVTARTLRAGFLVATAAGLLAAAPALAQNKHLTLVGLPSGFAAPHGTVFASLAYSNRQPGGVRAKDGSLALGFGLGNAETGIGWQFTADIASLTSRFADSGSLGIKASRRLAAGAWPVYGSVSVDRLAGWGAARNARSAATLAFSTVGNVQMGAETFPVVVTLGAGNRVRDGQTRPGVFFGAGVGLTQALAASAAWSGDGLDLGIGLRIPEVDQVNFTFAVNDVTDRRNSRRVTLTATWAVSNVFGR